MCRRVVWFAIPISEFYSYTLKMETVRYAETSVNLYHTTRRRIL
jgi:hypothetical protein